MVGLPVSYSIYVQPDVSNNHVDVNSGVALNINLALAVWDPELQHFEMLMENKLMRNEDDAFLYNARQYFDLSDELIEDLLAEERYNLNQSLKKFILIMLIAIVLLLAVPAMLIKLSAVITLVALALVIGMKSWRRSILNIVQATYEHTYEQRFTDFCASMRKKYRPH